MKYMTTANHEKQRTRNLKHEGIPLFLNPLFVECMQMLFGVFRYVG